MKVTIVGIKKGENKKGNPCFNYYGLKDFSEYDVSNSECCGHQIVSEFSYKDYGLAVGDMVDFRYEPGYEGKATLSDVVMIKMAVGTPFDGEASKEAAKGAEKKDSK